ncbi:MAG: sigma-70 family RNA polymerase sigma factor [Pseudomonadales bacterium]|nr:sigma-70 family RNA polymerase sigma factor [Pseudomonadales bacterium]
MNHKDQFLENQSMLYGIAYRMLGSFSDAEDIIQDAWLRWQRVHPSKVKSPTAYLASTVSRLCIDRQRRSRFEQLNYPGPWLPEAVDEEISEMLTDTEANADLAKNISLGFVSLLQKLPPVERAVFILKEAFDFSHNEIADTLEIQVAHSRQLLRRAKQKMSGEDTQPVNEQELRSLLEQFQAAATSGDLEGLKALMTEDIVAYNDGGGKATAAIIPLVGLDRVCTVMMHLMSRMPDSITITIEVINAEPAVIMRDGDTLHSCHSIAIKNDRIHRIYTLRNPEKMRLIDNHQVN